MTDQTTFEAQARGGGYCANCCFYDPLYGTLPGGIEVPPTVGGVCRKRSPTQMFETGPLHQDAVSNPRPAIWPMTAANDWCGDHPLRRASADYTVAELTADIRTKVTAQAKERAKAARAAGKPPSMGG